MVLKNIDFFYKYRKIKVAYGGDPATKAPRMMRRVTKRQSYSRMKGTAVPDRVVLREGPPAGRESSISIVATFYSRPNREAVYRISDIAGVGVHIAGFSEEDGHLAATFELMNRTSLNRLVEVLRCRFEVQIVGGHSSSSPLKDVRGGYTPVFA